MRYLSAVCGLLASCYSVAACADFQTEIGFGYSQHKTRAHPRAFDELFPYDHRGQQIYLDLHFDPVSTEAVPLSDAAFLGRSSHLHLSQDKLDFEAEQRDEGIDAPAEGLLPLHEPGQFKTRAVEGFWVDQEGDFALRLGYARHEDSSISDGKFKAYLLGVGYYLSDSSYLELRYYKYRFSDAPNFPAARSSNPETYQLSYKNIVFSGQRAATDVEVQVTKTPFGEQLGTSLAWYAGTASKIGLSAAMNNRDRLGMPSYRYGAFYEVFFNQEWLLRLTYDTARHGVDSPSGIRLTDRTLGLVAALRF